jgi:hypothetical protein
MHTTVETERAALHGGCRESRVLIVPELDREVLGPRVSTGDLHVSGASGRSRPRPPRPPSPRRRAGGRPSCSSASASFSRRGSFSLAPSRSGRTRPATRLLNRVTPRGFRTAEIGTPDLGVSRRRRHPARPTRRNQPALQRRGDVAGRRPGHRSRGALRWGAGVGSALRSGSMWCPSVIAEETARNTAAEPCSFIVIIPSTLRSQALEDLSCQRIHLLIRLDVVLLGDVR